MIVFNWLSVSVFWHFNAMLHMNLPVMVIWWYLAMGQSASHSKPTFKPQRVHFYFTTDSWPDGTTDTNICLAVMESPHSHKTSQRTSTRFKPSSSYPGRVISRLLLLAGDVETNSGPGIIQTCTIIMYRSHTHFLTIPTKRWGRWQGFCTPLSLQFSVYLCTPLNFVDLLKLILVYLSGLW